jgi:hypothetical protein
MGILLDRREEWVDRSRQKRGPVDEFVACLAELPVSSLAAGDIGPSAVPGRHVDRGEKQHPNRGAQLVHHIARQLEKGYEEEVKDVDGSWTEAETEHNRQAK